MKSDNVLSCPKAVVFNSSVDTCDLPSPEIDCIKGECVHECPKHGKFKINFDGSISWWKKAVKSGWTRGK